MEAKILKQHKNPLLHREEILISIESESSPSFEEVKKHMGKNEDLVIIKRVKGNFGAKSFNAEVFVYDSKEAKDKVEVIPKKIRKKMEEEAKKKLEETKQEETAV